MMAKCEGLESQLEQANCRAEFLAQEVDEQHLRLENASKAKLAILEKKYQDQIRLIEMDFSREKEIMIIQSCHLRQDIDRQMNAVQEQLSKFRSNIKILEEENKRLETDCQLMKCQNNELVQNFLDIQRHVEESDHLNAKIAELESMENAQDRKNLEQLGNEMKKLKEQNKQLQDQNDELLIEKESLRQQLAAFILASYQHQHNSNQPSQRQQPTMATTVTNQSSIFSSSSFTPESIMMAPTAEIMMMIESGTLPIAGFSTTTGRSKKRKRRRRRKKNKNKTLNNTQIETNTTENSQINNENKNHEDQEEYDKRKKHDLIVDVSSKESENEISVELKTNPKLTNCHPPLSLSQPLAKQSNNNGPEDDHSSTFSTITTHGDDFDDDDDDMDDDYDDFSHQTELLSSLTLQQRHKRIKQPTSLDDDRYEEEEEKLDDDDDDDDDDNLQTLIHHPTSTSYMRSLSDEINFDRSRPVFANQPVVNQSSSLEHNLQMILNQMLNDNHHPKENDDQINFSSKIFDNNETILRRALQRIENALNQIHSNDQSIKMDKQQQSQPQSRSSSLQQDLCFSIDHNNNPNPNPN
nr:protein ecdysoneless homolog isoform X2 [Dermatophagoides farinae]